jgi:hypothetical protein
MTYPPEGCAFEVHYPDGRSTSTEVFADEFAFGRWFREREAAGEVDRESRGLSVFCVTEGGREAIDIMHPRLVRGRLEQRPQV